MTQPVEESRDSGLAGVVGRLLKDRHFLVAAAVLTVAAVGWGAAVEILGIVMQKQPVPWPEGVQVDSHHRLLSLAKTFGPDGRYERVEGDGVLWKKRGGKPDKDGKPDGEIEFQQDVLETLRIGTKYDRTRYESRRSNWYVSRIYQDVPAQGEHHYWHLDVTYYTGGLDKVPHVPERCLVAGGASILRTDTVKFTVSSDRPSWNGEIPFGRTHYVTRGKFGPDHRLEYYTFCFNGRPVSDWRQVRGKLLNPFQRYSYFAKIQFGPRESVSDFAATDRAAETFMRHALPKVLKLLPSPEDVERLSEKQDN